MTRNYREILDPYALAQFGTLWQVVVHASEPDEDRHALYAEAASAMRKDHRWREYAMQYHTTKSGCRLHVGFRFANPKDWFLLPEGSSADEAEGPFKTKKIILVKLALKSSTKRQPGVYDVPGYVLFTRDQAEAINLEQERLP